MLDYVKKIAVADLAKRRNALLDILREENIPFRLERARQNTHWVENIIVSFGNEEKKLVIGGHYDSVDGSCGAVDNASSVAILIRLAKEMTLRRKTGIEIVFFDREEYEDHGSEQYIQSIGAERISGAVILDMCGFGDTVTVILKGNRSNPIFGKLLSDSVLETHLVYCAPALPFRFSDDEQFEQAGIPNVALTTLKQEEAKWFVEVSNVYLETGNFSNAHRQEMKSFESSQTLHNGSKDKIDTVLEKTMQQVYSFLADGLL